jgi:hypothetical protein
MKTLKDAMKQALKEMNLEEIPGASSPVRQEFVKKVFQIMRPDGSVPRKISKLEDFP